MYNIHTYTHMYNIHTHVQYTYTHMYNIQLSMAMRATAIWCQMPSCPAQCISCHPCDHYCVDTHLASRPTCWSYRAVLKASVIRASASSFADNAILALFALYSKHAQSYATYGWEREGSCTYYRLELQTMTTETSSRRLWIRKVRFLTTSTWLNILIILLLVHDTECLH